MFVYPAGANFYGYLFSKARSSRMLGHSRKIHVRIVLSYDVVKDTLGFVKKMSFAYANSCKHFVPDLDK